MAESLIDLDEPGIFPHNGFMDTMRSHSRVLDFLPRLILVVLLGLSALLPSLSAPDAHASQILRARVGAQGATLYAPGADGKLAPAQRVLQGEYLQVSDSVRNGWRQVVVRTPGAAARWGWVPERDIQIADMPVQVSSAPRTEPSAIAGQNETQSSPDPARDPRTTKNERITLGLKAGVSLGLGATTAIAFQPGLDFGVRLLGNRAGALFIELDALTSWSSATTTLVTDFTVATFSLSTLTRIFVLGRNLFGSGLYAGAGAGAFLAYSLATTTDGTINPADPTITAVLSFLPHFAFGAKIGYDIRPVPVFSLGPEIQYNGALLTAGLSSSFSFLGNIRFHF